MPFSSSGFMLPYSNILDNLDIGVAVFDRDGNYKFVNTTLINWRNVTRSEFLSMNVHDFLDVLDICVFDLVMEQKQRISRLQTYKGYKSLDGSSRMRIVTGTPIFDSHGNIEYVVCMLQDIDTFDNLYHTLLKENKVLNYAASFKGRKEKPEIVATSPAFKEMLLVAENVASMDSTVLIYGESGSGKEVIAHYIHDHSRRRDAPLITVNCASFPENLIESELFGYDRGSFTGASKEGKTGLVEAADGGTLFLDEINSLPLSVQGKLLRTLEEKSILRIGSTKAKKIDFRLVAATNRNLSEMVRLGTFREDLYYRIQVIPLTVPPLRNRREDIIPLCLHFLHYFGQKYNIQKSFSDHVLEEARLYNWPGNVREVRNFVERMVVMTPRSVKEISHIPPGMLSADFGSSPDKAKVPEQKTTPADSTLYRMSGLSKELIVEALQHCGSHRGKTAEYLGISRRYLQYKIKEYHISSRCQYAEEKQE